MKKGTTSVAQCFGAERSTRTACLEYYSIIDDA